MHRRLPGMAAYNLLHFTAQCPCCGVVATMEFQLHAATSFGSDVNGRFANRTYVFGQRLQWWDRADPRFSTWVDHSYVRASENNEVVENAAGRCTNCKAIVSCNILYREMRVEGINLLKCGD